MGAAQITSDRWLKSLPTSSGFAPGKIDAEAGILYDVVMVQEGPAKGHGVNLEAEFINDLVEYDRRVFGDRGVKARFGHPSASSETMGTQLGVFKNIRKRKSDDGKMQAIGNLHLLEAAEESPTHPGMRSWMLKMAAEHPEFVMSSIVFRAQAYYQRKKNGHKTYVSYEDDINPELGDVFVEFGEEGAHFYTDLVEQGAATDSLFSNKVNPHLFVAQADQFLHDHPQILQFIKAHPEKVTAFFASLGIQLITKPERKMSFNLGNWLMGKPSDESEELSEVRAALEQAKAQITQLAAEKEAAENRVKEVESGVTALQSAVGELESQLSSAQTRITELEAQPAAVHTNGPVEPPAREPRPYELNPIYQQFRKQKPA